MKSVSLQDCELIEKEQSKAAVYLTNQISDPEKRAQTGADVLLRLKDKKVGLTYGGRSAPVHWGKHVFYSALVGAAVVAGSFGLYTGHKQIQVLKSENVELLTVNTGLERKRESLEEKLVEEQAGSKANSDALKQQCAAVNALNAEYTKLQGEFQSYTHSAENERSILQNQATALEAKLTEIQEEFARYKETTTQEQEKTTSDYTERVNELEKKIVSLEEPQFEAAISRARDAHNAARQLVQEREDHKKWEDSWKAFVVQSRGSFYQFLSQEQAEHDPFVARAPLEHVAERYTTHIFGIEGSYAFKAMVQGALIQGIQAPKGVNPYDISQTWKDGEIRVSSTFRDGHYKLSVEHIPRK